MSPAAVDRRATTLTMGHEDKVSGLSRFQGKHVTDGNPSRLACTLESDKPYRLEVQVAVKGERAAVTARLNGNRFVGWQGRRSTRGCRRGHSGECPTGPSGLE